MYLHYYVYAYLRKDGTPYYIGKGQGRRAWSKNHTVNLPLDKNKIILIEKNLTEIGAIALERYLIRWYGRKDNNTGTLRNRTDGGEGSSGAILTETTKDKIRKARAKQDVSYLKNRVITAEWREKISKSLKGIKPSEERNARVSASLTGRKRPPRSESWTEKQKETIESNRITCIKCNKTTTKSAHTRWHGLVCKW